MECIIKKLMILLLLRTAIINLLAKLFRCASYPIWGHNICKSFTMFNDMYHNIKSENITSMVLQVIDTYTGICTVLALVMSYILVKAHPHLKIFTKRFALHFHILVEAHPFFHKNFR